MRKYGMALLLPLLLTEVRNVKLPIVEAEIVMVVSA